MGVPLQKFPLLNPLPYGERAGVTGKGKGGGQEVRGGIG